MKNEISHFGSLELGSVRGYRTSNFETKAFVDAKSFLIHDMPYHSRTMIIVLIDNVR